MHDKKLKEIKNIIAKMFEPEKPHEKEAALNRNRRLSIQLSRFGPPVIDIIIRQLKNLKSQSRLFNEKEIRGKPVYHLMLVINQLARPEHKEQMAQMLLWNKIAEDKESQAIILQTLARIGDFSIIPHLKQFAERTNGAIPTDQIIFSIRG